VTLYRDPLAGLRSQIATKRGLLEGRERALPLLLKVMLPGAMQRRLEDLRAPALAEGESMETLSRTDAALDEILAVHEQIAMLLPTLRVCPDEVPDPPKPEVGPPWVFEERAQLAFRAVLTRRLAELSSEAWLVRWDDTTYLSRLRLVGAPIILSSRFDELAAQGTTFKSSVRTSVPRSAPTLGVRRERLFDGIGRALGVVRDAHIGSEVFDETFVVDADDSATSLLAPDIVRAILSMASLGPRLEIARGIVTLTWEGPYGGRGEELMPDSAFAVVLGLRAVFERG
jgi:hypothetical protein